MRGPEEPEVFVYVFFGQVLKSQNQSRHYSFDGKVVSDFWHFLTSDVTLILESCRVFFGTM